MTTTDRNSITEKELNYVQDFLSWELLAMKKCNDTANMCENTDVQHVLREIGKKHKQHYQAILNQLN